MLECHNLESLGNGEYSMAYAGEAPWHGLGFEVSNDLTPQQMLEAARLDWGVQVKPCYTRINNKMVRIDKQALVRDSDDKVLDIISKDWKPFQNIDAFEFFNDFVAEGDMSMETAGSLRGGKIVWALAKVKESFDLFGGKDRVDSYLMFTNPHSYGQSIDVRMTSIRVVCQNTFSMALRNQSKNVVKVNHRREFIADEVKMALGISHEKLEAYHEAAKFLSTKRYTDETILEFFQRLFPVGEKSKKETSKRAFTAIEDYMVNQPGAELGEGTFWQIFNSITYGVDHRMGRSQDTRLTSAWYGHGANLKNRALELALDMASAA